MPRRSDRLLSGLRLARKTGLAFAWSPALKRHGNATFTFEGFQDLHLLWGVVLCLALYAMAFVQRQAIALESSDKSASLHGLASQRPDQHDALYAMMDSPVGITAWLVEKFHHWSDVSVGGIENARSKDDLRTNIMICITTRTFNSASWIYYCRREEGGLILSPEGARVKVPTGCAVFPKEMLHWPSSSF